MKVQVKYSYLFQAQQLHGLPSLGVHIIHTGKSIRIESPPLNEMIINTFLVLLMTMSSLSSTSEVSEPDWLTDRV